MRDERGFTLVEVLVALGIFAALSAASVGIIRIATNAQEQAEIVAAELSAVERMRAIVRTDMLQVVPRPFRDPTGSGLTGPAIGGRAADLVIGTENSDETVLLAFVREGWGNPGYRLPRPSLQQVTYLTDGERLIRRVRPFVDAVEDTPFRDDILLHGLQNVGIEFIGPNGWQPTLSPDPTMQNFRAIRLQMTHPSLGPLTQAFLVGGA